ncbi:non-ribosomal peptide synthase/polyketide synthase [Xenorhabdus griffiniae]|uniref:non-ribosomal peptide synthase/polyketide synthase n=1 Tax=Xenorhabdus griffiniae TaxID=351672 RepID=UPI0030D316F6
MPMSRNNIKFPLSSSQQVVWLSQLCRPHSVCYNLGSVLLVEGKLDDALLVRAIETVVCRHDVLRLRLVKTEELPQQALTDALPVSVTIHDFSDHDNAEEQAEQYIHTAFKRPFDLYSELWRFALLRVSDNRWYCQFCCHHLIGDTTTLRLISAEIANTYTQLSRGKKSPKAAPSYLDFIHEDNAYLNSKRYQQDQQFWSERYKNLPPALIQPANLEKTADDEHAEPLTWSLDKTLFQRIEDTVAAHGLSVLHFMYSALACYFSRTAYSLTEDEDIVIGIPVDNRKNSQQKHTAGMFSSVIPVGITVSPHDTFLDVMGKTATELRRCYKHQRLPLSEINRLTQIQQQTGRTQLFDIMLSFEQIDVNADIPDATLKCSKIQRGAPFPLVIALHQYAFANSEDDQKPVTLEFNFSPNYLSRAEATALQSRLMVLIEAALTSLETPIQCLPLLPLTERQQLLVDFNATQTDFPQETLIHQLIEAQIAKTPNATAVVFAEQSLSYDELNRRANQLAHYLIELGVRPDDRVAICAERSLDAIVGLLGILKAGGAYVPLDPTYPTERLAYMLDDATPVVLLTQTAQCDRLRDSVPATVPVIVLDAQETLFEAQPTHNPQAHALGLTSRHLAYVIYTSGSTGQPKGVMVEHRNVLRLIINSGFAEIGPDDCIAHCANVSFDAATWEVWAGLVHGARIVLIPEKVLLQPTLFGQCLSSEGVSALFLTTALFNQYADLIGPSLSGLRYVLFGGEQADNRPAIRLRTEHPPTHLLHVYGPTETTTFATAYEIPVMENEDVEGKSRKLPIGHPIANTQIYILDTQGQPVPIGVAGEIHIAGDGVARGYLNRPELTAERFLPDPFSSEPDARMYKTGDLARWLPEGNIEYLGRNDFQIKLRGFRIELGEIEAKLRQCDGVREAVVLAREDEPGQKRLVAYLRPQEGVELVPAELRQQLTQHLADYMLPSAFVTLDTFPLTPNGKLDRHALPAPDLSAIVARSYEAPIGEIETALVQIWQELLSLEQVGRHDHFFELGGHSLLATQLVARVRQLLARELPLQQLFEQPVLMQLAQTLTSASTMAQIVIPVAERSQPLPLSFAQQRLWFLGQLDPAASLAYHIPVALRLTGPLNRPALTCAFNQLIARHESLRTRFTLVAGQPCQHIDSADIGFTLTYQDLRSLPAEAQSNCIAELTARDAQTPFDFTQGPLLRGHLLQLTDEEHILLFTQHHIITDGWSVGVLMHELNVLYRAILDGQDAPLPPLPIQYADYAVWQRHWLQEEEAAFTAQRDFWCTQLEDAPALLSLPTDRPRPAVQSFVGSRVPVHIEAGLLDSLKKLGLRHHTTLFMTVLSAWSLVLARLSGQDDIVIGTPVANRPHHELEGLIGFFVNTLALRITFNNDLSVADLLAQIRERALAAYDHQDLPFEQVVEALQPERNLSYSPIFQVMLALNNTPAQSLALPEVQCTPIEQMHPSAHFDLTLSLTETEAGLVGELEYASDLFDAATVERIAGYFNNVLTAMVADDAQLIATLPMLPASERQQLLVDFNATQTDFPQNALIHQLFEAQAAQYPDTLAVIYEDQTLSYGELNYRANQLAHYLITLGVCPDDRVALCTERSLEMVVGLLAILKAGGAYVPLDPAYPAERLLYMLEDAAPVALLTQSVLAQSEWLAQFNTLPTVLLDNPEPCLSTQPTGNPDAQALGLASHHLAYVIYTSGSTGQPKGVMIEHFSLCNLIATQQHVLALTPDSRVLQFASNSFDACIWESCMALMAGGRLYLAKRADLLPGAILSSYLTEQAISHVLLSPTALAAMDSLPDTLQTLLVGGEACPSTLVKRWSPGRQMLNAYGPTEITVCATLYPCVSSTEDNPPPIGRPIANTRIYILDAHGQPVPRGATGEIYIAGVGVARGYLNRPELTAERFLADTFSATPNARMYKTGDLGRWLPDGNIEYLGRNDFQVKLRGFRIELGEIETKLTQCGGVREAVVIAREDETNQKRLIAYLLPKEGAELVPAELRQQLAQHLADHMLPSAFVTLDAFPLTSNGKLDRQALPAPDLSAVVTRSYVAPIGERETTLAQIWQKLLGLKQVSRHDHFFELGGHSLMIISLIEELSNLGWQLHVRSVFAAPILNDMAQAIQRDANTFIVPPNLIPERCTAITPDMLPLVSLSQAEINAIVDTVYGGASNVQDIYPLAPLQEGILFHHLLQTQGDAYLLRIVLACDTREHLDAFLAALQQVIDRHDILRTAIYWQGLEQPVQVVWRQALMTVDELTPISTDDIPAQLLAHTDPHQHRINLNQAPLFAADIAHDPAQNEWLLALRFHHLVNDHMTSDLIFAEIVQILQGNAKTLPPTLPYRNFIVQTLSTPAAEHEAYFHSQLADIDEPTTPFGILGVPNDNSVVNEHSLLLDPTLAKAIRTQARRLGVSASVLFHVAWAQVLAHTSGRDDVVFGSVLLGRLQGGAGADRILGMFINTLPLRISLGERTVQESVQETYQNLTTLLEHEQAPLALAQRCSGVAPPLPLFSTLLNYRHSQADKGETNDTIWTAMHLRLVSAEEQTNYPITLSVDDFGDDFQLTALTVTDIVPERINTYLTTAISGLIDALVHHPQQALRAIPILPKAERQQVLINFNATQADFPRDAVIHHLFEMQAAQHPDTIAVVFEGQTLSYGELNSRANQLAHYLITLGVRPDDRVALCVERSLEMVIGLLAILKAGGAYVPLNPDYPTERLAYMLNDAAPVVLLTLKTQLNKLSNTVPTVLLDPLFDRKQPMWATQPTNNPDALALGLTSRHLAYVIYTSGSTGQPKGVMVEHRNVVSLIINNGFADIGPDDCIAHCANVSFDAATWEVWAGLVHGARILLIPEKTLLQPALFGQRLSTEGVSALFLTTALFNQYANLIGPALSGLRYVLFGGEQADIRPAIRLRTEFPPKHLLHVYGPTETTTFATNYEIPTRADQDVDSKLPIGHPIANTQIYILDTQGQPVPVGVAGEIYIAGDGVARGYLNRPELTAERFLTDPFSSEPDARMYKTGDLGRWLPDGNIEYLGRNDFQVKLRGFRIELGEIEARLTQCDGVREAVVLAREDEPGQKRLVAYLLPQEGIELVPAELRQQLAQHLADYMLPSAFITLDAFPLTPNGKLDRQALPAPDLSAVVTRRYEAPVGETEIILAEIWQDLLGLEHVGRYDHFFELGGHSLLAIQLAARIRQQLARELPLQQLFDQPLLRDLAHSLADASTTTQATIPVADRHQPLPLSFAQQRLWFLAQLDPAASLAYHIPMALRLTGQLHRPALIRALDLLVARHESLRTRFVLVSGQPCQQIDPADRGFALSYQDLRALTPDAHSNRIAELTDLEAQTPFDFSQGSLIRGHLLQLADEEHILLLTQHHIISDGWSIGVLLREFSALYRAALDSQDDPLPPLPIQYADYAVWQREWLQESAIAKQRDFWCSQLEGAPALLTLPTDRPRPAVQSYVGRRLPVNFDADLLTSLKRLGQRHRTTLFMTVLSAWSIVLARLSGQADIVIGTPIANRPHHELEGLIGFFVNTLALRITLDNSSSVADLLAQVREHAFAAYAHQDLPFEQVVEALQPERNLSYSPIFQVMLALNNTPQHISRQALALPELQLTHIEQEHYSAHFDLTLSLVENEDGRLVGELAYATDLFDATTIERLVGYLTNVLAAMVADETQLIGALPLLPESEQRQLLVEFNATQQNFPQDALIHQLVEAQAAQHPEAIAAVFEEQTISYGELNRRANQLAHHLIGLGVRPDDRVAICVERSPEMVIGLLAVLKAGGAYVPLSPTYPPERLAYVLDDAAPVVLLTQTSLLDRLGNRLPHVLLDALVFDKGTEDNPDPQTLGLTSHHLAYVIYTSGSTGQPKGVMVEHAGFRNYLQWGLSYYVTTRPTDSIVSSPFAFDATVSSLYLPLLCGGKLHLIREGQTLTELVPALLSPSMAPTTLVNVTPTHFAAIGKGLLTEKRTCPARCFIVGGEVLPQSVVALWRELSPESRIINEYGPTETVVGCITFDTRHQASIVDNIPIGKPIANTQIYVLDALGQPVPLGVAGEIYIGGAGVSRGYFDLPELTAERFISDPFSTAPNARLYKTGDLGRWLPDGNIEYLGRNDFQVKLRGFRIELGEIEAKLEQCHGVREAVVLAREDEPNQKRLVAYLRPREGVELVPAELRQQLAQHLADYMLPSAFVTLASFPLTPNGKLDRQALPAPDSSAIVVRHYASPVGEMEITLAQIWQKLLGLERVGRHDHFFELGGHSLMIVSLIEELRNLGWQLDVRSVFVAPVLIDMAQTVRRDANIFVVPPNLIAEECTNITPAMLPLVSLSQTEIDAIVTTVPGGGANVQDIYPLAPLQEGILFHHLLQTQGDNYLLQSVLAFDTRERLNAFLAALQRVIDRHDILRTAVCWRELAQPVQVVWRQAPLKVNIFTPTTTGDVVTQLKRHTDPRQHRINLNQAPLFAADIAQNPAQDEWLLVLRFHHLVSDHLTLELILAEITLILQGKTERLPAVLPYRNFIAQTLATPTAEHEAYFRTQLADIDEPTAPFGILKVHPDNDCVAEARLPITPDLAKAIRTQARRLGVSPSVLFHVAWAQVLAQTSGRDDVVFGSVLSGRLQGGAGADQILGMFINTLPLRISLDGHTVQDIVQDTYHNLIALLEHEQAPLVLAQQCSGVEQPMPLFSTLLNYRHSALNAAEAVDATWTGIRILSAEEGTNYPISLSVDDLGDDFLLTTQTITEITPERINVYLATAIHGLVDALVHNPQQAIRDISILPAAERQQLLVDFNATQVDLPQEVFIHLLFEAQAAQCPDAIAVVYQDQTLSYGELNRRANQLAHHLIGLGVRPDDRVAICVERSPEMVIGLLAVLKAGGAYVPLSPTYPPERLAYVLDDAAPVVLLTQTSLLDKLGNRLPLVLLDDLVFDKGTEDNPDPQTLGLTSHHLAYVIYTSGSTGQPKGVMVEHAGFRNYLQWGLSYYVTTRPTDSIVSSPFAFDATVSSLYLPLLCGGKLHLIREEQTLTELVPALLSPSMAPTTLVKITPTHFAAIGKGLLAEKRTCPARCFIVGGEALPQSVVALWRELSPESRIINEYGPTETVVGCITFDTRHQASIVDNIPIGKPSANTQIYILDAQGQPVPLGVAGEIYIGGAGVSRGYLNQPERTAERFIPDPFSTAPNARLYKTGDLGRWLPDGNIEYLGRNDFQVKIRGFRIELGEIENRLVDCEGVQEAVVIAREEENGDKRLVAYLIPQPDVTLNPTELREQLSASLMEYMLPSAFITLASFPLTPNGKLDRKALPAPDLSAVVAQDYVAPVGEIEITLAQIWQELLGLERVGRHDHFFELGGHSLLAIQLVTHIHQKLARDLPLQQLFDHPVLMHLAQTLTGASTMAQIVIPVADRSQPLPLSFAQQRLWFLGQLDPAASLAYHIPVALRLTGPLHRSALTGAFNQLIARHESLRTRFVLVDGQPCQHIDPADIGFTLPYQNLRLLAPQAQDSRIAELTALEAQTPFDFTQEQLIRGHLLQLADEEHVLLLTQHHIISDGWSIGVLVHELSVLYRAILDGQDTPLPPLPIQYVDYTVWQRHWLQDAVLTTQRDFWCTQLAGTPALLTLPTDRPRPAVQSFVGSRVPVYVDADLLGSLKKLGLRHHSTLFMTVLSAWSLVLARLSGQDDIVIGTPVANRPHHKLEGLIGFFVNTLALRITFNDDLSVADLLAHVRERALAAYAHQDLPFEQVVEALQPERNLSYSPIFQVMLALNNTPTQALAFPDVQCAPIEQMYPSAHFDLTLSLTETETGLIGELEYVTDLFDTATVERIAGYFNNVLTAMVADETQRIATLPMLSASERQQLLVDFNATQVDFPQDALIHQRFEAQAAGCPQANAIVFGEQTISYGELNRRANQLAHYLIALGVCPDDRIAICVERSLEMVVGLLGILKAGAAYVPLDPAYPAERLAYMLDDVSPVALLTQVSLVETLSSDLTTVLLDTVSLDTYAISNPDACVLGLTPHHLAYVIYTSGSTGQPKGVMVEHRGLYNLTQTQIEAFHITANSRLLQFASFSFDACISEIATTLCQGACLVLASREALLPGEALMNTLKTQAITHVTLPPVAASALTPDAELPNLTTLVLAGEACSSSLIKRWATDQRIIINAYGPTESTVCATLTPCDPQGERVPPIGRPIANTQIYILDTQGQPVPLGVTGEIYIGGLGIARGYLNRPELTAERFLTDPFSSQPDARVYKTGDLGRWLPDGNIEYLGRNDFQVKLRGFRIELGEIEARLMQCHGVREAVVLAREDEPGQKRLVAYLRPQEGIEPVPTELRQQLAQYLADYMLPSAFVILETFPLTPNGKLDRQALPAPDLSAVATRSYETPIGETEIALAQIWQKLLGLKQVSRHDHFFELGGHSLMIVRLIEELRKLGWQLDVRSVFVAPILVDMAQTIQREASIFVVPPNRIPKDCTAITPDMLPLITLSQTEIDTLVEQIPGGAGNVQDIYPLAPLQEGILFHHLLQTQGDNYLQQSLLAFDTRDRLDSFLKALQQVINRHDILRTAIYWQGLEQPVQVVWRQAQLTIREFPAATTDDIPAQLLAHTDPRQHRINLNQAPLFATDIAHDPAQDEWLLALRFHHLVSDHLTLELIFAEIALILQAKTEKLPPISPYRNFIAQTLNTPTAEHEAYFRTQLADIDEPTAPFGVLNVKIGNDLVTKAHLAIAPDLAKAIRTQARRFGVSPSVLFHIAWAQVLAQTSGRDDVVFGSVLLGRLQGGAEADQILGMFINTLPLRISLDGRTVQDIVQETYHNLTALLEHEQAPLVLAQQCSGVEQPMPLFSTLLNYRHSFSNGTAEGETEASENTWAGIRVLSAEERTNYPISLSIDDLGEDFQLTALTITEIVPEQINAYLATAISGLIDALINNPQQAIRDISILPAAERQQVLTDFNATQVDFPQATLIHPLIETQAAQHPDALAVIYEDQTLSYGELNHRANQLAHYLIALGVHPDDRVAICAERSLEMIVGFLAILKAGGAYVPLDPAYPSERLAYMLDDAAPVALLTQSELAQSEWLVQFNTLPTVLLDNPEPCLANQPTDNPNPQALGLMPHHLAYVIYTSGSTGQPKGVMIEHHSLCNLVTTQQHVLALTADSRVLQSTANSFDPSIWEYCMTLMAGARLYLAKRTSLLPGAILSSYLTDQAISHVILSPTALAAMDFLPDTLQTLMVGGEACSSTLVKRWSSGRQMLNAYGPTETTVCATLYPCSSSDESTTDNPPPIGRPIANTRIYILDAHGQPVPRGVAGEIYIAGAGVARGYLNRPELTAERFLPDPFSSQPDARMYKTGDLGRWLPEGNIEYLGRNDFQVKLRGFRIELGEIETRLNQCDGVREAVVIAREDEPGQKRLVAYLLPQEGVELAPAELRQQLAQYLADYMLPSAFVTLDTFPLTPNGKLDRQALPAPDSSAVVTQGYEPPQGGIETVLAQIWQNLLGLERVSRHDHFFELGGHSLMVVRLITRIQDRFLVSIPLTALFTSTTLVEQANVILSAQMNVVGGDELESIQNDLDSLSAEELMTILSGKETRGGSK